MGKERISGDFSLGISQVGVQASLINTSFPQLPPQLLTNLITPITSLVRKVICNYKKVISLSHISTPVITTNFKYKYFGLRVPLFLRVSAPLRDLAFVFAPWKSHVIAVWGGPQFEADKWAEFVVRHGAIFPQRR